MTFSSRSKSAKPCCKQVYTSYVTALQDLAALQDGEVDSANVPVIRLRGLREIAIKFGLQSEELKKAQEMLSITAEVCSLRLLDSRSHM